MNFAYLPTSKKDELIRKESCETLICMTKSPFRELIHHTYGYQNHKYQMLR